MNGEQLLWQLVLSARSQERAAMDEAIRIKERVELLRQHRMELEEVHEALKKEIS